MNFSNSKKKPLHHSVGSTSSGSKHSFLKDIFTINLGFFQHLIINGSSIALSDFECGTHTSKSERRQTVSHSKGYLVVKLVAQTLRYTMTLRSPVYPLTRPKTVFISLVR